MDNSYPFLNPVLFKIGFFELRWYSLAYIFGFIAAYFLFLYSNRYYKEKDILSKGQVESLLNYCVLGVILGGRAGFILFYEPLYYLHHPLKIFALWEGGMSFHGGFAGIGIGILLFCGKNKIDRFKVMDRIAFSCTPGLFFGRIANFINGELWGKPTNGKLGIVFPSSGDFLSRHPSQLYEALLEGMIIFITFFILIKKIKAFEKEGLLTSLFLILYSIFRFFIEEFFREAHNSYNILGKDLSTGQMLCLPLFIAGILTLIYAVKKNNLYISKN